MKFNIDAFKRFNKYVNTPEKVGRPAPPRTGCCLQRRAALLAGALAQDAMKQTLP